MKKIIAVSFVLASCAFIPSFYAIPAYGALSEETANQTPPSVNFDEAISKIADADSEAAVIRITEEALSGCKAREDYGRFASALKKMSEDRPAFKYADALYYAIARARIDELACLAQKNDIESGRLYMSVSESYRNEALENIDKTLNHSKSKDLILDAYMLKFLATKEEFQPQAAEAFLDDMASKLATYSDDSASNKRQLARMADQFWGNGLGDYALKLKIAYAGKVDPKSAQEIFEDIRKDADKSFAQGNVKSASAIYDAYISAGQAYLSKDLMGARIMEIAEKYFGAGKYHEALKYYESFAANYPDSNVIDYCKYKKALCYYNGKDYESAETGLGNFLSEYKNSVWFDRAFEALSRLYFREFPKDKAVSGLQKLIDSYYRKNIGDFAYILIALLRYNDKEYKRALDDLKKVDMNSGYSYTADAIIADIKDIKKGSKPSYSFGSKDKYRYWEPGKAVTADMVSMETGDAGAWIKGSGKGPDKRLEVTYTDSGAGQVTVKPGTKIKFALSTLADEDRFAEYLQDKEDLSRLPKKVKEEDEKDFISLQWTSEGGKFSDERQSRDKVWEAPNEPGSYRISVLTDDLGLVREPDKGIRKDPAREVVIIVNVAG
ncbi:MAG: tetratricopeptide repeat protein [Candidatus Omnitrophota bacterium]|nr:tetratricopeptide repeat protein [Candidatus Omnitrophota bacterium]